VEGFDPAVQHLGKAGEIGHITDRQTLFAQQGGSAAGRENLDPEAVQLPGELDDAGFVRNAQQSAFDGSHGGILSFVAVSPARFFDEDQLGLVQPCGATSPNMFVDLFEADTRNEKKPS
jgi:hypothetical protein